jgi:hypothetical protein
MQTVHLVFLSIFNATYMCPNIQCDGVKSFWVGTKQGLSGYYGLLIQLPEVI